MTREENNVLKVYEEFRAPLGPESAGGMNVVEAALAREVAKLRLALERVRAECVTMGSDFGNSTVVKIVDGVLPR